MKNFKMKQLLILALLFIGSYTFAQVGQNNYIPTSLDNFNNCITSKWICGRQQIIEKEFETEDDCLNASPAYYKMYFLDSGMINIGSSSEVFDYSALIKGGFGAQQGLEGEYTLYGPFEDGFQKFNCEQIALGQASVTSGMFDLSTNVTIQHAPGYYILKLKALTCPNLRIVYEGYGLHSNTDCKLEGADCQDCISSFSPDPGQYLISAWTKGEVSNRNKSYENPGIAVSFVGAPDSSYFTPSGKIIDDWQRIEGVVTVPPSATDIKIGLYCQDGDCYFDDIRFVPLDGGMVSYVYDPISLRLVAELDERNYATFYEYDEEGKLVRVKKETERGIMTIQENRESLHKP